jgi:hypothetical protein
MLTTITRSLKPKMYVVLDASLVSMQDCGREKKTQSNNILCRVMFSTN